MRPSPPGIFYHADRELGDAGFFLAFPTGAGQPAACRATVWGFNGNAGPRGLTTTTRTRARAGP